MLNRAEFLDRFHTIDDEQGLDDAVLEAIGESLYLVVNEKPAYRRI
jgi:hypothetical protein